MKTESNEQRLETNNDVINRLHHIMERWQERLTLDNLRIADRYVKGELHILVRFRIGGIDEEHIAFFQRALPISGAYPEGRNLNFAEGRVGEALVPKGLNVRSEIHRMICGTNSKQQAVLVD